MTLEQLIARLRDQINSRIAAYNEHTRALNDLRGAEAPDQAAIDARSTERAQVEAEIATLRERLEGMERELEADQAMQRLQSQITPIGQLAGDGQTRTQSPTAGGSVREPRTYSRAAAKAGRSFFSDVYRAQFMYDRGAQERLDRHMTEVRVEGEDVAQRGAGDLQERAVSTGGFAGLVIPQYLPEFFAPVLRAGQPVVAVSNRHQLPDEGMTITIQRGTTGAATAVQASENTAVQSTDEVWADLVIPVRTIAGQQQVSRQALERGHSVDEIVYGDLARAYVANKDNQVINGSGASGQMLGILNTGSIGAATAFGAALTVANFNLKIAGQIAGVTGAGAGITPRIIVMHPRRWGWYTSAMDSAGRPVVMAPQVGPFNASAVIAAPGAYSADGDPLTATIVGYHSSGLPVITDLNIPINVGTLSEDVMLVLETNEIHLWEDGDGLPRQLMFEQTAGGSLTTTLVVYGYAAFTAGRYPQAVGRIGGLDATAGNGLIAPAF